MEQWSDEEIRQALLEHNLCAGIPVTASTRSFLLRKLQNATPSSPTTLTPELVAAATECLVTTEVPSQPVQCSAVEAEGYYGVVSTPNRDDSSVPLLSPFYTNKSDTLQAIKGVPGARFKKFDSQAEAESFSQQEIDNDTTDSGQQVNTQKNVEKANNFPSLKTPNLSAFRSFIEKGDVESFLECVQKNPRYLITIGDAPEILKPPTRYNALHCAVIAGQVDICTQILSILQDDNFWAVLYPDDDPETVRPSRKQHLLDLYLNMQDKGLGETPLHFACKLGHVEVVALLLSLPLTNTTIRNRHGQMPADVVCQKASTEDKAKIEALLAEPEIFYVPVLRTEDNSTPPQLGHPLTLEKLESIGSQVDGCELPWLSNGLAGPMSPKEAKHFYQEWRSPGRRSEMARIKRTDSDRGMERIGRQLAHDKKFGWNEYWDFLGASCDLSKPEGLDLLEDYLCSQTSDDEMVAMDRESPLFPFPSNNNNNSSCTSNDSEVSRKLFDDEEVVEEAGAIMDAPQNTSPSDEQLADMFAKKLNLRGDEDCVFILGSAPTKLDRDVFLALCGVAPDVAKYPCITHWLGILRGFSEEERKTWRTPRKQLPGSTPSHPVSPLVISSPSVQTFGASSPLVSSGAAASFVKPVNAAATSNTPTSTRYWPRQSTTPRGRGTPHSRNGSANNTTPRRHAQARVLTPTRYGKLSYTPKIL